MSLNLTEAQENMVRGYYGLNQIGDVPRNNEPLPSGMSAVFLPIDEKNGVKFYSSGKEARKCYYWSKIIHSFGMGPDVWNLGCVTLLNGNKYGNKTLWYFCQQRVAVIRNIWGDDDIRESRWRQLCHKQNERCVKLFGIKNADAHCGNWGLLGAKLVMIDVGDLCYIPSGDVNDYYGSFYIG